MSRSVNKVILVGNVGAEPEIRKTSNGTIVATVSLATNRPRTDRFGHTEYVPSWHRIVFWEKLAKVVADHVHKGDRLYIEGRIEYSQHTDNVGVTRYYTDIVARELVMLGGGRRGDDADDSAPEGAGPFDDNDNLPF